MFSCKDCGDCSLPDIAFLCPESQCAKNQRKGPCGGTRDGKCEVEEFECISSRAYDRLKSEGRERDLLSHAPVIQDETLRGTSSWANALLKKDHTARKAVSARTIPEPTSSSQELIAATNMPASTNVSTPESESKPDVRSPLEKTEKSATSTD